MVICSENRQPPQDQPQLSQSYYAQPQHDQVHGSWPSGGESEGLDPGLTRNHPNPAPAAVSHQAQTSTQDTTPKQDEQPKDGDKSKEPQTSKESEATKANVPRKDTPTTEKTADEKAKDDKKAEEDEKKKADDDAKIKAEEDAEKEGKKKADEGMKPFEAMRQEDLTNHLIKPLYMLMNVDMSCVRSARSSLFQPSTIQHWTMCWSSSEILS